MKEPRTLARPRGTRDVLPAESARWQAVESTAQHVFESFGYAEIRTPIFEDASLYQRSTGATTDIVSKEMYAFEDKKGRLMALRPEGTPGVVRAYIQGNLYKHAPQQKLYYIGPMFRYERPQAGRARQFSQLGVEAIGYDDVGVDFELIAMAWTFYRKLGIPVDSLTVKLNSLGNAEERSVYSAELRDYLQSRQDTLCVDCVDRLDRNPMRVFDCKNRECAATIGDAPRIGERLGSGSAEYHNQLCEYLGESGIPFEHDPGLVRGLDYYTRTVFEIVHTGLGAQDALLGGGRYDDLIEQLGGPPTPAAGFAFGLERILLALEWENITVGTPTAPTVYIAPIGDRAGSLAAALSFQLGNRSIRHFTGLANKSLKSHLKTANRLDAHYALILGSDEIEAGVVTVRDLHSGTQEQVSMDTFMTESIETLSRNISR